MSLITGHVDMDRIQLAAESAAHQLMLRDCVSIELTPGDHTRYLIVISSPPQRFRDTDWVDEHDHYVSLIGLGGCYQWGGQQLNSDYVFEKWANGNRWTAEVLTEFLNRLSAARGTGVV